MCAPLVANMLYIPVESKTYFFLGQKPKTCFFVVVAKKPGFCLKNLFFLAKGNFWGLDARSCCKQSIYNDMLGLWKVQASFANPPWRNSKRNKSIT